MNEYQEIIKQIKEKYTLTDQCLKNIESFISWLWKRNPELLKIAEISQYFNDGIVIEWTNDKSRLIAEINDKETRYQVKLPSGELRSEKHPVPIKVVDDVFEALKEMYK